MTYMYVHQVDTLLLRIIFIQLIKKLMSFMFRKSFHFWVFVFSTASLVCPLAQGAMVPKLHRRNTLRHTLYLGRKFQGSFFFSVFEVAAVGNGLMLEIRFSWVHHENHRIYYYPSSCEASPSPHLCWGSSGMSIPVTVQRAPVIVICSFHHTLLL